MLHNLKQFQLFSIYICTGNGNGIVNDNLVMTDITRPSVKEGFQRIELNLTPAGAADTTARASIASEDSVDDIENDGYHTTAGAMVTNQSD